jgi:predicted HTH domain antitoxin
MSVFKCKSLQLSLGKAAELAGYDRLDFIQKLQFENEAIFDYETDLVNEMVNNADLLATNSYLE